MRQGWPRCCTASQSVTYHTAAWGLGLAQRPSPPAARGCGPRRYPKVRTLRDILPALAAFPAEHSMGMALAASRPLSYGLPAASQQLEPITVWQPSTSTYSFLEACSPAVSSYAVLSFHGLSRMGPTPSGTPSISGSHVCMYACMIHRCVSSGGSLLRTAGLVVV